MAVQPSGRVVDAVMTATNSWSLAAFTSSGSTLTLDAAFAAATFRPDRLRRHPGGAAQRRPSAGRAGQFHRAFSPVTVPIVRRLPWPAPRSRIWLSRSTGRRSGRQSNISGADTQDGGGSPAPEIEGSFTDSGTTPEAHTVTINWEDGTTQNPDLATFTLDAGETTFSYPLPQYAVSGQYNVEVQVADADEAHPTPWDTIPVSYTSSQPSGLSVSLDNSTIYAGGTVSLSGSFTDPDSNFAHLVTIYWSGGLPDTTLSLSAGTTTFQATSQAYVNYGNYAISVTVGGLGGISLTRSTAVAVNATTTDVVASPANYGQPVTLTATVQSAVSGNGTPTGTVDFYDQTAGADLGTSALNSSGVASLSVSNLAVGGHTITATYSGDSNFPTSQVAYRSRVGGSALAIDNVLFDDSSIGSDPTVNKARLPRCRAMSRISTGRDLP